MKRIVLVLAFLLYAHLAFADCLQLPIVGNGRGDDESSDLVGGFRPKIPAALLKIYPKLANTYTTVGFPAIVKGKPAAPTVITCFLDSVILPPGLGPMTRDQAMQQAHSADPKITFNPDVLKLPEPKTSLNRFIERATRLVRSYIGPALAWATSSTDNFNRGTGSDLGAAWDPYNDGASTDCALDADRVAGSTDLARCVEGYSTYIPGANQYVQFTLRASGFGGAEDVSAYVRLAAPTTLTGYACRLQGPDQVNRTRLRRYDGGGSNSSLANDTTTTWIDGDIARCEITGSTLTAKQNGVTVLTASDATYGSGRGGIGVLSTPGVGNENWTDDFEVGDLATTTVVRHKPLVLQ